MKGMRKLATCFTMVLCCICLIPSAHAAVKAPIGSIKVAKTGISKKSGFYCGLVKKKWVPGKLVSKVYFFSHTSEISQLKKLMKKERDAKKKKSLEKKIAALTSLNAQRAAICDPSLAPTTPPIGTAPIGGGSNPGPEPEPTSIPVATVKQLSAAKDHSCRLYPDGVVKCWGRNIVPVRLDAETVVYKGGLIGDGTRINRLTATTVQGLPSDVVEIDGAGNYDPTMGFSLALTAGGSVKGWGYEAYWGAGQTTERLTAQDMPWGGSDIAQIALFGSHGCLLLTSTGGVRCWGENLGQQLGGEQVKGLAIISPVDVPTLTSGATYVAVGKHHSCAVLQDGSVNCWGLGATQPDPTNKRSKDPTTKAGLNGTAVQLALGDQFSCALLGTGAVQCWGNNLAGQLGNGTTVSQFEPASVINLPSKATQITAGIGHACALLDTGGVVCWGANDVGQRGDGTRDMSSQPVAVQGLSSGVSQVDAGWYHTCALMQGGGVKCWGDNEFGKLGNNSTTESLVPVNVIGM